MPVDVWALDGLTLDGAETRRTDASTVMATGVAAGARSGVRPGDPGLTVTLAGATINVSAGVAMIGYAGQGVYRVALPSTTSPGTLTAAHATLARIDLVYLRVWDNAVDGAGLAKGDVVYLAGTAAASPTAPTPAGTMIYMPLATITVPASGGGSASVSSAVRPVTVAPGGIVPDPAAAGSYVGQYRDNGQGLQRWNGTSWSYPAPLGIGRSLFVRKPANTARTSATMFADDHLSLAVEANSVYTIEALLHWTTTDESTADLSMAFTVPSGATGTYLAPSQSISATSVQGQVRTMSTDIAASRSYGALTDTANPLGVVFRGLLITGASAGSFTMVFARTGGSGTVTMLANSWLLLTKQA
jgi:hypothetical protein